MANADNEIVYQESDMFAHDIDIELSNETVLFDGKDIVPDTIQSPADAQNNVEPPKKAPTKRTANKRTKEPNASAPKSTKRGRKNGPLPIAPETVDLTEEPLAKRTRKNQKTTPSISNSRTCVVDMGQRCEDINEI